MFPGVLAAGALSWERIVSAAANLKIDNAANDIKTCLFIPALSKYIAALSLCIYTCNFALINQKKSSDNFSEKNQ